MPKQGANEHLSAADRRLEVASILAKGVIRWRRRVKATRISDAQESAPAAEIIAGIGPDA